MTESPHRPEAGPNKRLPKLLQGLMKPMSFDDVPEWRKQFAEKIAVLATLFFPVAFAVTLPFLIEQQLYSLILVDATVMVWLLLITIVRRAPLTPSGFSLLVPVYMLTVMFYITLGPDGARPVWLTACVAGAASFFGMRGVIVTTFANTIMLMVAYGFVPSSHEPWQATLALSRSEWASIVINTNFLAFVIGTAISTLLRGLTRQIEASEKNREKYQLLAENATDVIWTMNLDLSFTFISPSVYQLRGYAVEEAMSQTLSEMIAPRSLHEVMELFARQMELVASGEDAAWEPIVFETEQLHKSGATIFTSNHVKLIKGPDGSPISIMGVTSDISGRKEAERDLAYEANFRKVLSEVAISFINLAPLEMDDGIDNALASIARFVGADRSYVLVFDFERGAVTNTHEWCEEGVEPQISVIQSFPIEPFEWIIDRLEEHQTVNIPRVEDLPPETGEAKEEFLREGIRSMLLEPLVSDGACFGTLGFDFVREARSFTDREVKLLMLTGATLSHVLSRKRAEEERRSLEDQLRQSQKMEAVGRLAGGVAHDFNNMLSAISGTVDLLNLDLPKEHPVREPIKEISVAVDRAADLTRQLLAFSRKQVIEPKVIDLSQVVQRLHPMLVRLIGEDIDLKTVAPERLGRVRVDPGQIEQVVLNLAVNARDAMPDGGQLLIATADLSPSDKDRESRPPSTPEKHVTLTVSDTGCGMFPDVKAMVFEPFFTTKKLGQGSGLGLATVLGIVEQNDGRIEVDSDPGRGSSFKVYFPRVDEAVEQPAPAAGSECSGGKETVLLVEDEAILRRVGAKLLEVLGYEVLVAGSGDEAIALARQRDGAIDLLFTDVVLPSMNGRVLAEQLTEIYPRIKVLYTSGYTDEVISNHGILDDGLQFISKPYSLEELSPKVRSVLDGSAAKET